MSDQAASEPMSFDDLSVEPVNVSSSNNTIDDEQFQLAESLVDKKELKKAEGEITKDVDPPKRPDEKKITVGKKAKEATEQEAPPDLAKEAQVAADKAYKILKLKSGDSALEVRDDTIVPVKVDGKVQEVALRELQSQYAGKVDYTRKYQEFSNERKTFYTERDGLRSSIDKMYKAAVQDKNPRLAIDLLCEALGANPKEVWESFTAPARQNIEAIRAMTDEELAAKDKEDELQYYRSKEDLRKADQARAQEQEAILTRIHAVRDQYKIEPEQFKACYDELHAEAVKTGFDVAQLTPEMVGQYYDILQRKSNLNEFATSSYGPERAPAIAKELSDVWTKNPDLTIEDIKDIAAQAFGSKGRSSLAKRIKETQTTEPTKPQTEAFSWDEL